MKKIVIVILFLFLSSTPVFSESLPNTDHVAGVFEKLQEKIALNTKFSNQSKADYKMYLLQKRLGEVVYAFDVDRDLIERTSTRYTTYVQDYQDFIVKNKIKDAKTEKIAMLEKNLKILNDKQKDLKYETGWWIFNQHSINATNETIKEIKNL